MRDDALIGTWLLRSHRMEDRETGETTEPFGATPSGVLIIGADGRMAALFTGHGTDGAEPALIAYSGRYRLTPGRLITTVDVASFALWVGSEQERAYAITGDALEISTAPAAMPGVDGAMATKVRRMEWVRETSAVASGGTSD
jgi:hypothetical protein